jgi:hypothetical protein
MEAPSRQVLFRRRFRKRQRLRQLLPPCTVDAIRARRPNNLFLYRWRPSSPHWLCRRGK